MSKVETYHHQIPSLQAAEENEVPIPRIKIAEAKVKRRLYREYESYSQTMIVTQLSMQTVLTNHREQL